MGHVAELLPLPQLPRIPSRSPEVVRTMDRIRRELDRRDDADEFSEFYWFAREYPRHYRYLLDCAAHRMKSIALGYEQLHGQYNDWLASEKSENCFQSARCSSDTYPIYWDFDSYLVTLGSALDLCARICGPAFPGPMPITFNKFCKRATGELKQVFARAQERWVRRLKDYRDCTVHFTPMNNLPFIGVALYSDGWELRAPIPKNPFVREAEFFRYSRRVEMLRYVVTTYRHMMAFDRAVARLLAALYRQGRFPRRTTGLFGV